MTDDKNSFDLTELNKLESYLKDNGYAYKRIDRYPEQHESIYAEQHQIVVHNNDSHDIRLWDVVINEGSYGHQSGLLELMIERGGDVKGCLTAEEVIELLPNMRRNMAKKCKECPYFKIMFEPYRCGGTLWDMGRVKCEKHNLISDYASKQKLERLECIEKEQS